jgi:hypothetical protein
MSLIRRGAQQIATLASPAIRSLGGMRALNALTTYAHILNGQGAGSGWDSRSETATVASLVDAAMPTVLDVGANNGKWSLSLAIALNRESNFHLFEVAPFCFPDLEKRASEIKSAKIIKKAVSDSAGIVEFYIPSL